MGLVVPPIVEKEERQAAEEKPIKEDKLEELGDRVPEDNGDVPEKPKEGDTMEGTVVVPAMIEKEDKLEESGGGGPEGHGSVLEKPKKEDDLEGSGDRVPEKNGDMPEKMEVKTESLKNSDAAEDTIKESDLIVETRLEKSGPEKDSSFKKDKEESAGITCGEMQEERTTATTEVSENTVLVVAVEEKVNAGPTVSPAVTEATTEQQQSPQLLFPAFTKSVNCRKILVFLQKSLAVLSPAHPELALKLYLEIATATDRLAHSVLAHFPGPSAEFTSIAYDFLTQAFLIYEDNFSDGAAQVRAITTIVGTLLSSRTFARTEYETLITKTAQFAARLLKKPDQCRMVCVVSRLFYVVQEEDDATAYRNPQRVLECLQRGLKIADACSISSSLNVQLFVEILDYYVYYYEIGNPSITDKFVSGLIALINEHFDSIGVSAAGVGESRAYYEQILNQIRRKKTEEKTKEKFELIVC